MNACEKYRPMLVGLTDDELTPEEISDVNQHLNRCASCRNEFDDLSKQSEQFELPSFKEPEDVVLEQLWKSPFSRLTRNAGISMIIGGYMALIGYASFLFLMDNNEDALPKMAIAAMIIGFLILLGSVIRERIATYRIDQYKDVER